MNPNLINENELPLELLIVMVETLLTCFNPYFRFHDIESSAINGHAHKLRVIVKALERDPLTLSKKETPSSQSR